MSPTRPLVPVCLALLVLLLAAPPAWAHGGVYRGPGGALPPGQREPGDPTPPPPPPATGPVTPAPTGPRAPPRPSAPVTPGATPPTPANTPDLGGGRRTGRGRTLGMDSWMFWYEMNKESLQNLKWSIYARSGTDSPLHMMGAGGHSNRSAATHVTRARVLTDVIPALLWAMDPANAGHQDIESAAYIGLAKVTKDPVHIERIQKGLASEHPITREAAALALGLLRRERASDQFEAAELDRVRAFLFDTFEDEDQMSRARGFAGLALGLLGDQPTRAASKTSERLFALLAKPYANPDLTVALLMAVGLQPRDALDDAQRQVLRDCVLRSRLFGVDVPPFVSQYAALALGRIGDRDKDVLVLERALTARRSAGAHVQRSAAIGLGEFGRRVSAEERASIAEALLSALKRSRLRDASARAFTVMSLAQLVAADIGAQSTRVLSDTGTGDYLLALADDGRPAIRAYGALALGLIARAIGDSPDADVLGEYRLRARVALRGGLHSRGLDGRGRAAFAIALGLARDEGSLADLVALVEDEKADPELRGYAALGLGHLGNNTRRVLAPIRAVLRKRSSEQLRRATAAALGMLRDREAVVLLLDELRMARSQSAKGEVVAALAKVGDERAVAPLIGLLRNPREQDLTRALACAGLGIVGDLEWMPSLSRLSRDLNYRAVGNLMNEALSIL